MSEKWTPIVLAAQQQDSAQLVYLLEEFENLIVSACRRWHVPPSEQGDLQQEAYIGFLKAVYAFDPSKSSGFPGYAKQKTQEAVWSYIRRRNRLHTREIADRPLGDEQDGTLIEALPDTQSEEPFSETAWRSLLIGLSEREALAVEKIVIDGLSMAELARQEGVSPDTVKTWKQRAFAKIRAELHRTRT